MKEGREKRRRELWTHHIKKKKKKSMTMTKTNISLHRSKSVFYNEYTTLSSKMEVVSRKKERKKKQF